MGVSRAHQSLKYEYFFLVNSIFFFPELFSPLPPLPPPPAAAGSASAATAAAAAVSLTAAAAAGGQR